MMKAIDLHPNEDPPISAKPEEQFKLANQFETRFTEVKRQSYTTIMTAAEARELESYKTLYNANKISFLLKENVEL